MAPHLDIFVRLEESGKVTDPLSPYLFLVYFDLLSRMIFREELSHQLQGIKISRGSPPISYLLYADDIMCKEKPFIHYSKNVSTSSRRLFADVLRYKECNHNKKHLGLLFCRPTSRVADFDELIDRVSQKEFGGLGLRRVRDMNRVLVSKLVWKIYDDSSLNWACLLKSKYLRDSHFLEQNETPHTSSKIWKSIAGCKYIVSKGLCFRVSFENHYRTWEDLCISSLKEFTHVPISISAKEYARSFSVKFFINDSSRDWDMDKLNSFFPPSAAREILKIHLSASLEPRRIIWTPSKSGSSLYRFISHLNPLCLFCNNHEESVEHIFVSCPFARSSWSSKWALRTDGFGDWNIKIGFGIQCPLDSRCIPPDCTESLVYTDVAFKDGVMCSSLVVKFSSDFVFGASKMGFAIDACNAELFAIREAC
ncbi:hypothetical protein BUALT_Bualt02G0100200 [Buddleja alternifolia]|uniref:Reverse transcriptase zinc-binding domain-containing protein n=1 Tax=Buddleja alternifolia TaxID=168488 RepID=A0AAV6Y704_9LAMI|nr:hypothetical protein BUALT_Bualt02G0100200 [Buddleja alternifolia]